MGNGKPNLMGHSIPRIGSWAVGAFALPANSKDAALKITLPAGAYSAQVRGANGTTGVAIMLTADGSPEWKTGGVTIDWSTVTAEVTARLASAGSPAAASAR